jgi:peroxiredoxin Q/BCP
VVGISHDDVASHKDFCNEQALPFPLLADSDGAVARAFGVSSTLGFYHRMTFLIDGGGVVRRVFDPVKPATHAREVLAAVSALSGRSAP